MLNREKTELARLVSQQLKKKEHLTNVIDMAEMYKEDIKKLSDVVKQQMEELSVCVINTF